MADFSEEAALRILLAVQATDSWPLIDATISGWEDDDARLGQPQASLAQQLSRFLSVAAWCLGDQDSDWGKAHRAITEAARKIARDNSVLAPLREGQTDAAAPAKISHRILALPQLQHG